MSPRSRCLRTAALAAEQRRSKELLAQSGESSHSQWKSLQFALNDWILAVCSMKPQIAHLDWTSGTVSLSPERGRLEQQCTELLLGWRGQLADAQARRDANALAAGLAALEAQAQAESAPAPEHIATACELAHRAMERPPGPRVPESRVMTQTDWEQLTASLANSFEDTRSIAELQCGLMTHGGVTPPEKCQARLEAALRGQLTPIIRSLEKAARTADPVLPGAQPTGSAPRTWESVYPCAWDKG
ncbi:hypothetical protein, partial [Hyalangium sp.]|uniref:hypothetical protein n=1 Tax=Hyalangium sp. TaxID=2028555 RepID=UPI002D5CA7F0